MISSGYAWIVISRALIIITIPRLYISVHEVCSMKSLKHGNIEEPTPLSPRVLRSLEPSPCYRKYYRFGVRAQQIEFQHPCFAGTLGPSKRVPRIIRKMSDGHTQACTDEDGILFPSRSLSKKQQVICIAESSQTELRLVKV